MGSCDLPYEKLRRVFQHFSERNDDEGSENVKLTRGEFARVIRVFYKVTQEIGLNESLPLGLGPTLRNLRPGELLEVLAGPVAEPSSQAVKRVHCRALSDGVAGWTTVCSGTGSAYLL